MDDGHDTTRDTGPDNTSANALLTVAQVARLAGITVRTLHHYDAIGLLAPSARSEAGYRLYAAADVERLRAILVWRRLDVALADIARLLDPADGGSDTSCDGTDPTGATRLDVLERQLGQVTRQRDDLERLATELRRAIELHHTNHATTEAGTMATDQAIIEALGGFDPADHEAEAHERWGDTAAHATSRRRTRDYTADDWREIRAEAAEVEDRMYRLFAAGEASTSGAACDAVAAHWAHVARRYTGSVPVQMQRGVADIFVDDPRFTAHYDGTDGARAGFARWVADAAHANADRPGADVTS